MRMRIAVTGRQGQVVQSLIERARGSDVEIIAIGRPDLDLANPGSIAKAIEPLRPDIILSVAAYTAVDRAESEPGLARLVNADGAGAVAALAGRLSIPILHLSTDYIFDGSGDTVWREEDAPGPLGVYGRTKLAGELAVAAATPNHAIIRTAWVYGPFGSNFVKTMLRLAAAGKEVGVVDDQHGNPTSSLDIADGLLQIAANLVSDPNPRYRGTFHMAGGGDASWADLAEAVFAHSAAHGGPSVPLRRITTAEFPTAARRPANSRLDSSKLAAVHGVALPHWREALPPVIDRLLH